MVLTEIESANILICISLLFGVSQGCRVIIYIYNTDHADGELDRMALGLNSTRSTMLTCNKSIIMFYLSRICCLYSKLHLYINISENKYKLTRKICICIRM